MTTVTFERLADPHMKLRVGGILRAAIYGLTEAARTIVCPGGPPYLQAIKQSVWGRPVRFLDASGIDVSDVVYASMRFHAAMEDRE